MTTAFTEEERARIALATELRRGMHLLLARDPSSEVSSSLTSELRALFDQLEAEPERTRGEMPMSGKPVDAVPVDGEPFAESVDRPISGAGNPFSIPMTMYRDGDAVVSTMTLEAGFEGAPGRSHGGVVAAIFDDLFGSLPMLQNKIAFTASLSIKYVSASPVFEPVTYRGWIDRVEGKKIFVEGEAHAGDVLVTAASGLFIDATDLLAGLYSA